MDSNRIFTNFKELLAEENLNGSITVIPGGNLNSAESILKFPKIVNTSKILLHIVVNDIDEQYPQDLAFNLKNLSEKSHRKFSSILIRRSPRGDYYEGHVHPVNQEITYQLRNTHIKGVDHKNLEPRHLHNDRHLRRNKVQGEAISAVQLLAKNIYGKMSNKHLDPENSQKHYDIPIEINIY